MLHIFLFDIYKKFFKIIFCIFFMWFLTLFTRSVDKFTIFARIKLVSKISNLLTIKNISV